MERPSENNIVITLPINLAYAAIDGYLKENYTGEIIKDEKDDGKVSEYAEILAMSLERSEEEEFDIAVDVTFRNLTSIFRNKTGRILMHLSLNFDQAEQEIYVDSFKLKGHSGNWLMDKSMQAMANTFLHKKIKNKMVFNFREIIAEQLQDINKKLEDPYKVKEGINLYGNLKNFRIQMIIPKIRHFYVLLHIEADAVMDIEQLNFNTPPSSGAPVNRPL